MLLTVGEDGCPAIKVTSKRGDTQGTKIPKGRHRMVFIPNPTDKDGDPWLVLLDDQSTGQPLARYHGLPGITLEGLTFVVLPDKGWNALLYKEAVQGTTKYGNIPQGRHSFVRRINPSGKATDPPWLVLEYDRNLGKAETAFGADSSVTPEKPLFPPYFNSVAEDGTRASGPPAVALQLAMQSASRTLPELIRQGLPPLVVTGTMDDPAIAWLKGFQTFFGLEPDGNFGPDTRGVFYKELGVDIARLTNALFLGPTTWIDVDGTVKTW
jgi:hypothetical protein